MARRTIETTMLLCALSAAASAGTPATQDAGAQREALLGEAGQCVAAYAQRFITTSAPASDVADAALMSCGSVRARLSAFDMANMPGNTRSEQLLRDQSIDADLRRVVIRRMLEARTARER